MSRIVIQVNNTDNFIKFYASIRSNLLKLVQYFKLDCSDHFAKCSIDAHVPCVYLYWHLRTQIDNNYHPRT